MHEHIGLDQTQPVFRIFTSKALSCFQTKPGQTLGGAGAGEILSLEPPESYEKEEMQVEVESLMRTWSQAD